MSKSATWENQKLHNKLWQPSLITDGVNRQTLEGDHTRTIWMKVWFSFHLVVLKKKIV